MRLRFLLVPMTFAGLSLTGCKTPAAPAPIAPPVKGALVSPWDTRTVPPTHAAYDCGQPFQLAPNIAIVDKNYTPGDKQRADSPAVYAQSSDAVADLAARIASAADTYQQTGNLSAATCAANLLAAAATDHAMAGWMFSRDARHEQTKGLRSLAIGYLKIRNSGVILPSTNDYIIAWMEDIAHSLRDHYDAQGCRRNYCLTYDHNVASTAFALASVAIAANDHGMFSWSVRKYRQIVSEIDDTGMLPPDIAGRTSLKFHLESTAALVQVAEYGELNNDPLYAYDNGAIHSLIHTTTGAIIDPTPFVLRSHARQSISHGLEGWEIGWATIYVRRFPDPLISKLLGESNDAGLYAWGGAPFGTEPDN
jgi:poly(beta-D-mannuronate) lyase